MKFAKNIRHVGMLPAQIPSWITPSKTDVTAQAISGWIRLGWTGYLKKLLILGPITLWKKGQKNWAGASPLIRAMPESKHSFLGEIVPYMHHYSNACITIISPTHITEWVGVPTWGSWLCIKFPHLYKVSTFVLLKLLFLVSSNRGSLYHLLFNSAGVPVQLWAFIPALFIIHSPHPHVNVEAYQCLSSALSLKMSSFWFLGFAKLTLLSQAALQLSRSEVSTRRGGGNNLNGGAVNFGASTSSRQVTV